MGRSILVSMVASMVLVACTGGGGDGSSTSGGPGTDAGDGTVGDSADDGGTVGDSADGSASAADGSSGESSDESSDESADDGSDTGGVDPTPILEREPAVTHDCTEARAMTQLPGATSSRVAGLVAQGGEFTIAISGDTAQLRSIALDGTVGPALPLETQLYTSHSPLAIAVDGDIATVWTAQGGGEVLRFAQVGADSQFVVDPIDVPATTGMYVSATALVATGGGFALFYGGSDGGDAQLYQLMLDAGGQAVGEPVEVAALGATYGAVSASVASTGDGGHALAYVAAAGEGTEVFFVVLDADGAQRFEPRRISRAAGDGWWAGFGYAPRRNLIAVGDRFWLTYSEGWSDFDTMEGHTTIALAELDGDGDAQVHTVQAPTEGIEHRWPSFAEVDGSPALMWTTGTIIWICGGCVSDHDLNLVLLDPEAIVPASEVVTQPSMFNGIIAPVIAVDGSDILTAGSLDFHALTMPASGALRCTPSD